MTDNVFETGDKPAQQEAEASTPSYNYVGEGKKYADPFKLDQAYGHAEQHIQRLEAENNELRARAEQGAKMDSVLERLDALYEGRGATTPAQPEDQVSTDGMTAQDIERIIAQRESQRTAEGNLGKVREELVERYGDQAAEMFSKRSQELGVDLNGLAAQSPTAVLEFFKGIDAPQAPASVGESSVNSEAVTNQGPATNTYDYWANLRKEGKISTEQMLKKQWESLNASDPDSFFNRS